MQNLLYRPNRFITFLSVSFFLLLLLGGIFFLFFSKTNPNTIKEDFSRDVLRRCPTDQTKGRDTCFYDVFRDIVIHTGIVSAQTSLHSLYKRQTVTLGQCHEIAHIIGDAAITYKDIQDVFSSAIPMCDWGYVHGVFEKMRRIKNWDVTTLAEQGGILCKDLSLVNATRAQNGGCYHGLGHGIASFNPRDLISPLQACDQSTQDAGFLRQCYAGVFMELARPNFKGPAYFYRFEDPFYPCGILPEKYLLPCYTEIVARALPAGISRYDIVSLCKQVSDKEALRLCIHQIYGSIAYGPYTMEQMRDHCISLPEGYFDSCIQGVARNLRENPTDFGEDAVDRFCNTMRKEEKIRDCLSVNKI